jgi:hypothetical protein
MGKRRWGKKKKKKKNASYARFSEEVQDMG